jgi:hypothetical protein
MYCRNIVCSKCVIVNILHTGDIIIIIMIIIIIVVIIKGLSWEMTCTIYCNHRIAATLYTVETVYSRCIMVNILHKGDIIIIIIIMCAVRNFARNFELRV